MIELENVLAEGRVARQVEDGIYSVLPSLTVRHRYDKRARIYDLIVGTLVYNSLVWGNSPVDYAAFAREAITSADGRLLDAACGSMLFTAYEYIGSCRRPVIAFDRSLVMLRRARERLKSLAGSLPGNIILLQGDLTDLPFKTGSFGTILCMNVLHHLENAAAVISSLSRSLTGEGHMYLTSLVRNGRFVGDHYLSALYRSGEFVRPRSGDELREILHKSLQENIDLQITGNMAYAKV